MTSRKVKALGEIALRVNNLDAMQAFYQDVIGLELMRRFPDSAFFKIADGYGGHTQILALFDRRNQPGYSGLSADKTTVDHLAFTIAREDFDYERDRLQTRGCKLKFANHDWVHWRSLYFNDPEGNNVEFVCYDPTV
ncbi:MAG TPA: VOC family protein [Chthoniobacterales bacterium]|nr:VOC family protein [Chthoniobacterales bacterium]